MTLAGGEIAKVKEETFREHAGGLLLHRCTAEGDPSAP